MEWLLNNAFVQDLIILAKPALFNLYFALLAIPFGFPFAVALALGKNSRNRLWSGLSRVYIYAFRGSPLFIQFFMFYSISLALNKPVWKPMGLDEIMLHPLFLSARWCWCLIPQLTLQRFFMVRCGLYPKVRLKPRGRWV